VLAVLLVELELVLLELEELILEAELELELELLGATTFVAKAGNEDDFLPSLTEMTTLLYVPMAAVLGTPLRFLVTVLNCAQPGLLVTLKPSLSPLGSVAVGVKLYVFETVVLVLGTPLIITATTCARLCM